MLFIWVWVLTLPFEKLRKETTSTLFAILSSMPSRVLTQHRLLIFVKWVNELIILLYIFIHFTDKYIMKTLFHVLLKSRFLRGKFIVIQSLPQETRGISKKRNPTATSKHTLWHGPAHQRDKTQLHPAVGRCQLLPPGSLHKPLDQPHLPGGQTAEVRGATIQQPEEWRPQTQKVWQHEMAEKCSTWRNKIKLQKNN